MKYRAISKLTNDWVYTEITNNSEELFKEPVYINTLSIGLGILDDNEKEIYTGDILTAQLLRGVVKYLDYNCGFVLWDTKFNIGARLPVDRMTKRVPECKIIGNIHKGDN